MSKDTKSRVQPQFMYSRRNKQIQISPFKLHALNKKTMSILPDSSPEVESPRSVITTSHLNAIATDRRNGHNRVKASQIDPHTSLVASQPELQPNERAPGKQDKELEQFQIHNDSQEINHTHSVSINSSQASIGLIPTLKTSTNSPSSTNTDPLNLLKTTPKKSLNRSPERKNSISNSIKKRKSKFEIKNESDLLSIGNQDQDQDQGQDQDQIQKSNPNSSINNLSFKLNSSYDSQLLMNENTSLNNSYDNNTTPGTIIPLKAHTRDNSPLHKGTPIRKRNLKEDNDKIKKFTNSNNKKKRRKNNKSIKIINKSQNIDFINSEMAKILSDDEYGNNKKRLNGYDVDNDDDDFNYDDFEDSVISPVVVTPKNYIRKQISGQILDYENTQVKKDTNSIHDTIGNNEEMMTSTVLRHGNGNTNGEVVDKDQDQPIWNTLNHTQAVQEKKEDYDDEFESDSNDDNDNHHDHVNNLQNLDGKQPIDNIVHNDNQIVNEQDDIFRGSSNNFKESQILSSDDYNMKMKNQNNDNKSNATNDIKDLEINTIDSQLTNFQEPIEKKDLVTATNNSETEEPVPTGDDEDISFTISKVQDFIQMKRKQLKEDLREDYIPHVNKEQESNKIDENKSMDQVQKQNSNSEVAIQWNQKDWKKLLNYIRVFKITKNYKMLNIKKLKNEFKILNLNDFYLRMRILQKMILIKKLKKSYQKRDKFYSINKK